MGDSCSAFLFRWNKVLFGGHLVVFGVLSCYCPDLDSGFGVDAALAAC